MQFSISFSRPFVIAAGTVMGLVVCAGLPVRGSEPIDFERSVAPILIGRCIACHGSDDPRGGLDLTNPQSLLNGSDSGVAIVANDPESSYLIERVTDHSMPPKDKGGPLTDDEITTLTAWVRDGADWPAGRVLSPFEFTTSKRAGFDWWSLQPVKRQDRPAVKQTDWLRTPIDAFVLHRLEEAGLHPADPAEKLALLRRACFDLTGLPPTPAQLEEFLADQSADAYDHLIDRLLASPHYGERWARHWLDVVRFSESDGFEEDQFRDHAWRYRDYVIDSFNADKPYTQFVREQIAGDAIEPVTAEGMIATSFLVAGPWDFAQKVSKSETEILRAREAQMEELVGVVSQTFLGLTVNCARCHNHKFDPISQADYYRIKAVFDGVDHSVSSREHEQRPLVPPTEQRALATKPAAERESLEKSAPCAYWGVRVQPKPTYLFVRGNIDEPGEKILPGGLSTIQIPEFDLGLTDDAPEAERRRRFADWLTDPRHPLTARVMVNRVWQYHFGQPLVENPSDFGFSGGRPSHPELLDWLASEFAANGYHLKSLHKLIMLSATYRQSSRFDAKVAEQDAYNRLLWRFQPRRLEGEVVRDAMLAVTGQLDPQLGGPSFRPFNVTVFNTYFYHLLEEDRPEFRRRTIYRMNVNTGRDPLLDALDCPAPSLSAPSRRHTTTALQALALMNSPFVLRQASAFAGRLIMEVGSDPQRQIALAYRLAFGREPTASELVDARELVEQHGLESFAWTLFNASEFLFVR